MDYGYFIGIVVAIGGLLVIAWAIWKWASR